MNKKYLTKTKKYDIMYNMNAGFFCIPSEKKTFRQHSFFWSQDDM